MLRNWLNGVRKGVLSVKTEELSPEQEAKKKAEEFITARTSACQAEVNASLERHNCAIQPVTLVIGNQVTQSEVRIVSR